MSVCIDCGKKINKYFDKCDLYSDGLVCGNCDDQRKAKIEKIKEEKSKIEAEKKLQTVTKHEIKESNINKKSTYSKRYVLGLALLIIGIFLLKYRIIYTIFYTIFPSLVINNLSNDKQVVISTLMGILPFACIISGLFFVIIGLCMRLSNKIKSQKG